MGFEKMNEGVVGYDFAAWLCAYHPGGRQVFEFLDQSGTQGLIGLAALREDSRPLTADPAKRAQLEGFLDSFFEFDPLSLDPPVDEPAGADAAGA